MKKYTPKTKQEIVFTKSYKSHWYGYEVSGTCSFTIKNSDTDIRLEKGFFYLYLNREFVAKFVTLQEAKECGTRLFKAIVPECKFVKSQKEYCDFYNKRIEKLQEYMR